MESPSTKRWFLLVLVLAFGAHFPGLFGTWHYDDFHTIVQNTNLDDPRSLGGFFVDKRLSSQDPASGMYRPMLFLSFALNQQICGRAVLGFLLGNLAIHVLCAGLAFALARELVRRAGGDRARACLVATCVGGLYALHPLLNEGVSYVSARSSTLATLFVLGSLLCAVRASLVEKPRWDLAVAAWLLAAAGCFTKEIAVMAPLLFASIAFALASREQRRAAAILGVGLFAMVAFFLVVRGAVGGGELPRLSTSAEAADAFRGSGRSAWVNLLTQVVVVARYLGLFFWPAGLSLDHEARVITSFGDPVFLAALALLVGLSVAAFRAPRRRPLAAAGWLWFAFALAPTSSILPLNVLMNEHRLYLPAFGVFLWFSAALAPWLERGFAAAREGALAPRLALALAMLACVALGARTVARKLDFHSAERQWASAVAVSPGSPIARLGLGNELALRGDLRGAAEQFEAVVALDPRHDAGRINLAECLLRRYEEQRDRASLERAIELLAALVVQRSESSLIALKAARAYQLRYLATGVEGDRESADAHVRAVLRNDPAHAGARETEKRFARERAERRETAEAR
ncbi:MAG: hypothetical protein JNM84_20770 [Planctomycetes bacterium]|nr:hypothetical protein [Planctomycetota bacterium]